MTQEERLQVRRAKNRERMRLWRINNPEKAREVDQKRVPRKKDPEKLRIWYRDWSKRNPGKARERHLRQVHGISVEQYQAMLAAQGGGCAICGGPPDRKGVKPFYVDHDHMTGKIRGLLCNRHNAGLGHFSDDITLLEAAIAYLRRSQLKDT